MYYKHNISENIIISIDPKHFHIKFECKYATYDHVITDNHCIEKNNYI